MDPSQVFIALDFDHTIIDDNSDVVIQELGQIPPDLDPNDWTDFMDRVFVHLGNEHGVTKDQLLDKVLSIPLSPGIPGLFDFLRCPSRGTPSIEVLVVSDANTDFIGVHLRKHSLDDLVPMSKVFTNPSYTDEDGRFRLRTFLLGESEGGKPHDCQLCPPNLCKGDVLENHRRSRNMGQRPVGKVFYVGDGHNDFCPSLRLREDDVVFCRIGYHLEKHLKAELTLCAEERRLKAKVVFYSDAADIVEEMKRHLAL